MGRIAEMQKQKQEIRKKNRKIFLIVMLIIGVIIAITINPILGILIGITPLAVNAMFEANSDISKGETDLYKLLKEEVAPKEIGIILPSAEYKPYEGIEESVYLAAEYAYPFGEYMASDKITYNTNLESGISCEMQFSEVKIRKDNKDKNPFVSVFATSKSAKDIRSKIKISKRGTCEKGNVFKVVTGNNEFDEMFDIISPNKKLVSKVLTDDVIKEILKVHNICGKPLEISIIRNNIYVRMESEYIIKDGKDGKTIDRMALDRRCRMIKYLSEIIFTLNKTISDITL